MTKIEHSSVIPAVNKIFIELFEFTESELSPEKRLIEELDLDSLDAIDMAISFQRELNISPDKDELQRLKTLGDIYCLIDKYMTPTIH